MHGAPSAFSERRKQLETLLTGKNIEITNEQIAASFLEGNRCPYKDWTNTANKAEFIKNWAKHGPKIKEPKSGQPKEVPFMDIEPLKWYEGDGQPLPRVIAAHPKSTRQ